MDANHQEQLALAFIIYSIWLWNSDEYNMNT